MNVFDYAWEQFLGTLKNSVVVFSYLVPLFAIYTGTVFGRHGFAHFEVAFVILLMLLFPVGLTLACLLYTFGLRLKLEHSWLVYVCKKLI